MACINSQLLTRQVCVCACMCWVKSTGFLPPHGAWRATALLANITGALCFVFCGVSFWLVSTHTKSTVFTLQWFCKPIACNSLVQVCGNKSSYSPWSRTLVPCHILGSSNVCWHWQQDTKTFMLPAAHCNLTLLQLILCSTKTTPTSITIKSTGSNQ